MYFCKHTARRLLAAALLLAALCTGVCAAELTLDCTSVRCLSEADFSDAPVRGVYVSSVPSAAVCEIRCGARRIRAGDVLPVEALASLTVIPVTRREAETELCYRPIGENGLGPAQTMKLSLTSGKNTAPTASDSELETYRNISNTGVLNVTDAEGDTLTYTLVRQPKRGTVELHDDGSFTYTPMQNKVGKDCFVYTASDTAGNVSDEATVKIRIVKPTDKAVYTDLPAEEQYLAVWLRERGVYTGRTVDGNLCFAPDEPLTRGEFLVMAMALFDAEPEEAALTSGFADETATPEWLRPYIVSAFKSGMIGGTPSEEGLIFRPADALTYAEAAVMLQSIANLPQPETETVFAGASADESAVPVWAQSAAAALRQAGIAFPADCADEPVTRLAGAQLLFAACQKNA